MQIDLRSRRQLLYTSFALKSFFCPGWWYPLSGCLNNGFSTAVCCISSNVSLEAIHIMIHCINLPSVVVKVWFERKSPSLGRLSMLKTACYGRGVPSSAADTLPPKAASIQK
ncbi:hypothetical protein MAP00_008491 [Monascus purpureus]|nr:hypothetical protein MAP00_008491 [Monascus purpureus]